MLLGTIINLTIIILWLISIYYAYKLALEDYKAYYVSTDILYKFYFVFSLFQLLYFFDSISLLLFLLIIMFVLIDNLLEKWIPEIFNKITAISDILYIILLLNMILHLAMIIPNYSLFIYSIWIIFSIIFYYVHQIKIKNQWNEYKPFEELDEKKILELHSKPDKETIKEIWKNFKSLNFKTIKEINEFKKQMKEKGQQITAPAFFVLFPLTFITISYILLI